MVTLTEVANYARGSLVEVTHTYVWVPEWTDGRSYGISVRIEIHRLPDGRFQASPDRGVRNSQQATAYISIEPEATPEAALLDCIRGFRMFMKAPEETDWPRPRDGV